MKFFVWWGLFSVETGHMGVKRVEIGGEWREIWWCNDGVKVLRRWGRWKGK
ncbi:hypothetical protein Hanom_Chr01g00073121 [Helianthus anomalus]